MDIGRGGRGGHVLVAGIVAPEPQVVGDRAVEQRSVLRDDRNHAAHLVGIQHADVMASNADRTGLRIVLAQQQTQDGRLPRPARPDDAHRFAGGNREAQPSVGIGAAARIGEAHVVERDARCQVRHLCPDRSGGVAARFQQRMDSIRRRLADHARVQDRTQIAQRTEYLRAGHQDDQQGFQAHFAVTYPPGAYRDGGRRAQPGAEIGKEAGQEAQCEHPERAIGQGSRVSCELLREGAALAECLERRQALHRVEELFPECLERRRTADGRMLVGVVDQHRQRERRERGDQQHGSSGHVPPGQHRENHHRRAGSDDELRHVSTEEDLQLLHAVDDGKHHAAGAFGAEPGWTKLGDAVEQACAQHRLHAPGCALSQDDATMIERGPQQHAGDRCSCGERNLLRWCAFEGERENPAEKNEAHHAKAHGQQAKHHCAGHA